MNRRTLAWVEPTDVNENEVFGKIPGRVFGATWILVKCDAIFEQGTKYGTMAWHAGVLQSCHHDGRRQRQPWG